MKLKRISTNKLNPRTITEQRFQSLVDSILSFPKMMEIRPIVIDTTFEALGGNMRTNALNYIAAIPDQLPDRIIFHNRYCTSGDYMIAENNQPIIIGGHALVFNGTIDMGTKEEMEARSGYTMLTENDGELVLRDYLEGEPMRRLRSNLATFAGIFLSQDGRMYALRNEMRPLSLIEKDGCKIVCSTRDIALRAKFDENYVSRIEPMKMVRL